MKKYLITLAGAFTLALTGSAQAQMWQQQQHFDCIHLSDAMRIARNWQQLERLRPYLCHEPVQFQYQWRNCRGLIGLFTCRQ
jgi:hypothetical protein